MAFCENCGNNISATAMFCANCGSKISKKESASNSVQVNHRDQKHFPAKKKYNIKYFIIPLFVIVPILFFFGNGKNKYDSEGNKHGTWIEYINKDGSEEVPKDSASFIRHITYSHGMPQKDQVVKDYYLNGNIQSEFTLVSGPYNKNLKRPNDKCIGYGVLLDEQTSKIKMFVYYDDDGEIDMDKTLGLAFDKAKNDPRFDEEFFSKTKFGAYIEQYKNQSTFDNSSDTNDDLPPISVSSEFDNSTVSYNNQSSDNSAQSVNHRCNHCYGTGKCPGCKGPFTVHYWDSKSNSWKNRNETRPGYRMCSDCRGAGVIYGTWNYDVYPKQPKTKPCYNGGCMDGWEFCNECNNSGNGKELGICKKCKGTGISK